MFYFVFSATNAAKPEEFPRKPLGLELSLNPVTVKGNVAANGQNCRVGERPTDREPHPHRDPRVAGGTAEVRTPTLQANEAAEAMDTHLHPPGGEPPGEEGRMEPTRDRQLPSLLKTSEMQAHHHLMPTALHPEQPFLATSCIMVDHQSVSLSVPGKHDSSDSCLQNTLSPPDSSTAELSATEHEVWQQNPTALPAGGQESSLCKKKALNALPHTPPGSLQLLSSVSQHDSSPKSDRGEETARKHCRAVLPDKVDLKGLVSKAASTGELASLQQNEPGSTSGKAHWPEGLGVLPTHELAGGSVPVLSGSESEAVGLGKECPFQWVPSPVVEGNSPYTIIKTTTPLHLAHATEQDVSNRKQVASPLPEAGYPLPATSMPTPLELDPEEADAKKHLQKPLNAVKAPWPHLSPKPKLLPQVAKSRSENSFLSDSPPLAKLPKSVTF